MKTPKRTACAALILGAALLLPGAVGAHCDSLDGPLAKEALLALEDGRPKPLLKWVLEKDEAEVQDAFEKARAVRVKGKAERELADRWFLETLVRLHRASEGQPYTGLKPAGSVDSALLEADEALDKGSVEALAAELGQALSTSVKARFEEARRAKAAAASGTKAGRAYVRAYVAYAHLVEAVHTMLKGGAHHGHGAAEE